MAKKLKPITKKGSYQDSLCKFFDEEGARIVGIESVERRIGPKDRRKNETEINGVNSKYVYGGYFD